MFKVIHAALYIAHFSLMCPRNKSLQLAAASTRAIQSGVELPSLLIPGVSFRAGCLNRTFNQFDSSALELLLLAGCQNSAGGCGYSAPNASSENCAHTRSHH